MSSKKSKGKQGNPPVISPAGMRRDKTRADNNVGYPSLDSVKDEMNWRKEHQQ